ncbi:MAG: hypothetical protein AAFO69_04915 [Bacteroidota bacterium]
MSRLLTSLRSRGDGPAFELPTRFQSSARLSAENKGLLSESALRDLDVGLSLSADNQALISKSAVRSLIASGGLDASAQYTPSGGEVVLPAGACAFFRADQYDSDNVWRNQVANPFDGSSQADWDTYLGLNGNVSTDDPTHSADRFLMGGGDYFVGASKPPVIRDSHKQGGSGRDITFAACIKLGSLVGTQGVFSTANSNNPRHGWYFAMLSNGRFFLRQMSGSNSRTYTGHSSQELQANTYSVVAFSVSAESTDFARFWMSNLSMNKRINTFAKIASSTDSNTTMTLGALGDSNRSGSAMVSGGEFLGAYVGEEFADDAKFETIVSAFETFVPENLRP